MLNLQKEFGKKRFTSASIGMGPPLSHHCSRGSREMGRWEREGERGGGGADGIMIMRQLLGVPYPGLIVI